jgi:hypothetical protein
MIDLDDLLRSIEDGDRPSRSVTAALLLQLQRLGVTEVGELPARALFQASSHDEPLVDVLAHIEADEHWCCWHRRWEPRSAFGNRAKLTVCTAGATEESSTRPNRGRRPQSRKADET